MRKLFLAALAAAALVTAGAAVNRTEALPIGSAAISVAAEELNLTDTVHCRPGWWHHRFRPHNGCFRVRVIRPYRIYRPHRVYRWRHRR